MSLESVLDICVAALILMGTLATVGIVIAAGLLADTVRQINKTKEK